MFAPNLQIRLAREALGKPQGSLKEALGKLETLEKATGKPWGSMFAESLGGRSTFRKSNSNLL